jgi:hypothetical protein
MGIRKYNLFNMPDMCMKLTSNLNYYLHEAASIGTKQLGVREAALILY